MNRLFHNIYQLTCSSTNYQPRATHLSCPSKRPPMPRSTSCTFVHHQLLFKVNNMANDIKNYKSNDLLYFPARMVTVPSGYSI
mmetsp:Transcript_50982/g.87710  ORF Transcript_50982/g.87710 Transcript_50982/m.87710 type:complete len:83 (-) Transcript_50982:1007-1255(-)